MPTTETEARLAGEGMRVERPVLDALIVQARARWEAMSPKEREAMHQAQRESWVRAEMVLSAEEAKTTVSPSAYSPEREQQVKALVQASTALLNILARGDGDPLSKEVSVSAIRKFSRLMKAFDRLRAALAPFTDSAP